MFFSPDPTAFPGTGELCSNHFFQNITFVSFIFFCFFLGFKLGDRSHISWIDVIINYKWLTSFRFLMNLVLANLLSGFVFLPAFVLMDILEFKPAMQGMRMCSIMRGISTLISTGEKHALRKYDQFALNTSCFWGSTGSNITQVVQFLLQN